jgi:hypothetical protein
MSSPSTSGPDREDRRDAVRALVEHSWVDTQTPRPVLRPHWLLLAAALAAVAAFGSGVVAQMVDPVALAKAAPPPAPTPAPATYTAVSGWDCPGTADHGFEPAGRTSAWSTIGQGGWPQNGCDGSFETMPMTGVADKDDSTQYAEWWFAPANPVTTCTVSVYEPASQGSQYATAAQYWVLAGQNGAPLAGFVLDQTAQPGTWTTVGTYPINPGGIAVQLVDRGVPATAASRIAITQVRVQCAA